MQSSFGIYKLENSSKNKDLDLSVQAFTKICNQWDFWDLADVKEALSQTNTLAFYMATEAKAKTWLGALLCTETPDGADILYLYICTEHRGLGWALLLLDELELYLSSKTLSNKTEDDQNIALEVRPSNVAAKKLYLKFGMQEVGRRKAYYRNGEDALVFSKTIKKH
ncbi:MAG: GNAT family N-acetyltransferase [Oligoflexales bacterium]|nr:GNAT family N-acetyltransferase [Oligoflexales bacterium]